MPEISQRERLESMVHELRLKADEGPGDVISEAGYVDFTGNESGPFKGKYSYWLIIWQAWELGWHVGTFFMYFLMDNGEEK